MLRFVLVLTFVLATVAFNNNAKSALKLNTKWHMNYQKNAVKVVGAALIASSMISAPVFAKEGAPAKISVFGNNDMSSPFSENEAREDPMYSPYSPYGNGEKAVYNARKGSTDEVKFWQKKFEECV